MRASILTAVMAAAAQAAQVEFTLDLTWEAGAPNGVAREMIFINNRFPGPPLIVDQGDDVTVHVNNHLPFNTSIHFHGIEQRGTPWSDGVPGLSQWAIKPEDSFTYKWTANDYGTYWYHSHDKANLQDGLYGAIRIRPNADARANSPFSLISSDQAEIAAMQEAEQNSTPVVLSDWDHLNSTEYMEVMMESGYDIFCTDSVLVDGMGSVYCKDQSELDSLLPAEVSQVLGGDTVTDKGCLPFVTATQGNWTHHPEKIPDGMNSGCVASDGPASSFSVDPAAKWAVMNFISAASLKALVVSIDEHPMYVFEVDGRYIEPQLAHYFDMYNGERYSVLIKLDKTPGNYTMRIASNGGNQIISGYATLAYKGGEASTRQSVGYINYGGANTTADVIALDVTHLPPYPAIKPAQKADAFHLLQLGRSNSSWQWSLDSKDYFPTPRDDLEPLLYNPYPITNEIPSNLLITTNNGTWVDLVYQLKIEDAATPVQPPHPIHKHSNKAFLIGSATGKFSWSSVDEGIAASPDSFFLDNPIYRDTFVTSPAGEAWLAIRYQVVNPGPFFLHCHMETHLFSGMGLVLLDGIDAWPTIPEEYLPAGTKNPASPAASPSSSAASSSFAPSSAPSSVSSTPTSSAPVSPVASTPASSPTSSSSTPAFLPSSSSYSPAPSPSYTPIPSPSYTPTPSPSFSGYPSHSAYPSHSSYPGHPGYGGQSGYSDSNGYPASDDSDDSDDSEEVYPFDISYPYYPQVYPNVL